MFTARIILTIIGLVFGGPIGAIIGFLIGSYLDNTIGKANTGNASGNGFNWRQAFQQSFHQSVSQSFVKGIFTLMGYLAKIDGQVSQNEIVIASNVMTQLRLSDEMRHLAMRWFYDGKNQQFDLNEIISQLRPYRIPPFSRIILTCLTHIACANGTPTHAQQRALQEICNQLGIAIPQFNQQSYSQYTYNDQHHYSYQSKYSLADDYALMGLKPDCDVATIRKTYRRLMNKFHPDKLAAKGATEKEIKAASDKTIKIRRAYENLLQSKGVAV